MAGRQNKETRVYGAPMGAQAPVTHDYPKVGPADPETRRAKMAEHDAAGREETRQRAADTNKASQEAGARSPGGRPDNQNPTRDLTAAGAGRKISGRQSQVDRQVEEMARGKREPD